MKKYLLPFIAITMLFVLLAGLAGCDQIGSLSDLAELTDKAGEFISQATDAIGGAGAPETHPQPAPRGQTIEEYFAGQEVRFYRQFIDSEIVPISGDVPDSIGLRPYMVNEELFFNDGTEIIDDTLTVNISTVNNVDWSGGCTTKSYFSWPRSLTITKKAPGLLIATGKGGGHVEKTGENCENFEYDYITHELWVFTTERLEDATTVTVTTSAPAMPIAAPGWTNPTKIITYSQYTVTVSADNPHGFRVVPDIKVVRVNGYDEISSGLKWNRTEITESTWSFEFASFYNAEYVIVGGCRTYGKNSGLLGETWDDTEFSILVSDAPADLPEWYYPEK